MSRQPINYKVLGLDITFRPGADMERVKIAARLVEERYADKITKNRGGLGKDILLTFLALDLADELLRMKTEQGGMQMRLSSLLAKIEKSL